MLNDTWGLTRSQVTNFNLVTLADHISQWYSNNRISVLGNMFTVKLYLCQRQQTPKCVLHTSFSPTGQVSAPRIPRVTICLRDIVPEIADEVDSEMVLPLVELIDKLQSSLEEVQEERYMNAAVEAKKQN